MYEKAWTTYWWHEDFIKSSELYTSVESLAKDSRNVYDLELLHNLWFLLYGMAVGGEFPDTVTKFQDRTETFLIELERLSKEENRPSTALQAKTLFLQVQLALRLYKKESVDDVLNDLQNVIQRAANLPGYPLEPLVEILTELGEFLEGISAYEALFETIVKISSSHKGEISAARMLLKRGQQLLDANRPYEAIRSLGRTFASLYKYESRKDAIFALYLCACAYEQIGLLWAAHGTMLNAASLAVNDFWKYGNITPLQAACDSRMKWIELQLGRVPHILAWHEIDSAIRIALVQQGYEQLKLMERERDFDIIFGILFLKTEIWDLKKLTKLPDTLEELGLPSASIALSFSLGHEDELVDDSYRKTWGDEEIKSVFLKMYNQPASEDLPESPALYDERKVYLKSNVLGCEIIIESENSSPCVELAESVLAALESLLSTGFIKQMASREPNLSMVIRKSEFAKKPFEFSLQDETGKPSIMVACSSFDPHNMSMEQQGEIKEKLLELVSTVMARVITIPELDRTLNELFHEEHGLDRAISFTGSFVTIGNILGYSPKTNLADWQKSNAKEYSLKRSEQWNADILHKKEEIIKPPLISSSEDMPPDLLDLGKAKHTQMKTVSLIRETLWNKAAWNGTAFLVAVDSSTPPILAPTFKDQEAAIQIFEQWRSELGARDEAELLRISIVRGINKKKPFWYRVVIGSNPNISLSSSNIRYAVFVNRIHTMEPSSDENLERFIHSYNYFGQYFLTPAIANSDMSSIKPFLDYYIAKREIFIRYAWEIGKNDFEGVAIKSDDDPIIPKEEKNPPIIELLNIKRERETHI